MAPRRAVRGGRAVEVGAELAREAGGGGGVRRGSVAWGGGVGRGWGGGGALAGGEAREELCAVEGCCDVCK